MLILAFIFWLSVVLVAWSYVLYPLLIARLSRHKSLPVWPLPQPLPRLSVLMAAYNESAIIGDTLRHLLASNYPADRLTIWVGNDASSDNTADIVAAFGERVKLISFPGRTGKPQIINKLAEMADGEIFVFADANIRYEPDTIARLIQPFSDPAIGLTAGNQMAGGGDPGAIGLQEQGYLARETKIKVAQSLGWQVVIAPMGACYALRRELYSPVPPRFNVDDFYITLRAQMQGARAVLLPDARVYEALPASLEHEFRRKARMGKGNFQNVAALWPALWRFDALSFNYWSHKVLRWLTPFFILAAALAGLWLGACDDGFWRWLLYVQIAGWLTLITDWLLGKININIKLLRYLRYFVAMNFALLVGFFQWLKGVNKNTWEPARKSKE